MNKNLPLPSSASISLQFCFGIFFAVLIVGAYSVSDEHAVSPEMDLYVPSNSIENTTYICSIATPEGASISLAWELNRAQIRTREQVIAAHREGIYIDSMRSDDANVITLSVSEFARQTYKTLPVQCIAYRSLLDNRRSPDGEPYRIISYDQPSAMDNLQLVPKGEGLVLEWDRPSNVPIEVVVNYTVIINSADENITVYNENLRTVNQTSVSLLFLENQLRNNSAGCIMFEFSVSGSNDAGTGQPTKIVDTIPLSIDIRKVNETLKVEQVNLDPLSVGISFIPVMPCNPRYPLSNYTVRVDEALALVFDGMEPPEEDGRIHLQLNDTNLTLDSSFDLSVTACSDISCRRYAPAKLNTTDVQWVEAIFHENRLYLRCWFATDSLANGCLVQLLLRDSNGVPEEFEISREKGFSCNRSKNQFGAYSRLVVLDIEANGEKGNISLPVLPTNLSTLEDYMQATGGRCKEPAALTVAEITGIAVGTVAVIAAIMAVVIVIVVVVVVRRHGIRVISSTSSNNDKESSSRPPNNGKDSTDSPTPIDSATDSQTQAGSATDSRKQADSANDSPDSQAQPLLTLNLKMKRYFKKSGDKVKVRFEGCSIQFGDSNGQSEITLIGT